MNDLYSDSTFGDETVPIGYMEILAKIESVDEALRDVQKKHKKRKHSKKGGRKSKKFKKRLKAIEENNVKIIEFLSIVASQTQPVQPHLWQSLVEKSAPKLIDLASTVIQSKRPVVQYLPTRSQLCLTDNYDKK